MLILTSVKTQTNIQKLLSSSVLESAQQFKVMTQ